MADVPEKKVGFKDDTANGGQRASATTTIGILWTEAIKSFTTENNITIEQLEVAGEFQDADNGVDKATELFKKARHPKNKTDKVVTAVGGCLEWVDTAVDFLKDAVPDGYGTPAKIVAGSISYMIQAAKNVTADFDLIEETFENIHNALEDIGLLKNRRTREDHFTSRLMEIFLALFDFCQYSARMFKEFGRRRLWITALMKGRNEKIKKKCGDIQKAILLFRDTVPLKILDVAEDMSEKLNDLPNSLIAAVQGMKLKSSDLQMLLGAKKPFSVREILDNFKHRNVNVDAKITMEKQMELIESRSVPNTFSWVKEETHFVSWLNGQPSPFIYITGSSGAGKTYFTNKCYHLILDANKSSSGTTEPERARQTTSTAYYLFEPGKDDSQSFRDVLAILILQIAEQDTKLCDSMARELDKFTKDDEDEMVTFLWENLVLKKFEKSSETSRLFYILLDGIEQMRDDQFHKMLLRLQALGGDKHCIRVLMTGPPKMLKKVDLKSVSTIDLDKTTKSAGDISKVIDHRIKNSSSLKGLSATVHAKIKDKFNSWTRSVMSSVDLMLSLIEQSGGDEATALKNMEDAESPEWLYNATIKIVKANRSFLERRSVERLYSWCTFAKQPLRVDQLQHIWTLDTSLGKFDVRNEIQGKSSSLLYSKTMSEVYRPIDRDIDGMTANKITYELVSFRQPAFREHLESSGNSMIDNPTQEKVDIFKILCDILCSRNPDGAVAREALQEYASITLVQHLRDIDIKETSPQQGREVVEAISRVLSNENDVCIIFETIMSRLKKDWVDFDLYDHFNMLSLAKWESAGTILAWAKKMNFHEEEELSRRARTWVEETIKAPHKMLETLGCGHLENWTRKATVLDAKVPYKLTYRALYTTGLFTPRTTPTPWLYDQSDADITARIATIMLNYGRKRCLDGPVKLAKARISAALLLNESNVPEDRKKAAHFYEVNLKDKSTPGPERFYSFLGLAEYHARPAAEQDGEDQELWRTVQKYTGEAMQQWVHEKGALGSELINERCTAAFLLEAKAWRKLNNDPQALETCQRALVPGELQYSEDVLELLRMIVDINFKEGRYAKVVDEVHAQAHQLKCEWMLQRSDDFTDRDDHLRQAAVFSRRVDLLVQMYDEAIEYWQPIDTFRAAVLQYELSVIYRLDARATRMAERVLDNIIETIRDDLTLLKGGIIRTVFPTMVNILFENYACSHLEATKKKNITKLNDLINVFKPTTIIEPIALAVAMITLAKMQKGSSPRGMQRAMVEADHAFKLCIADLEDTIGSNDSDAFRALAKVLQFAGLKVDALIAASLQFSEVREYDDSEPRPHPDVEKPTTENASLVGEDDVAASDPGDHEPNYEESVNSDFAEDLKAGADSTRPASVKELDKGKAKEDDLAATSSATDSQVGLLETHVNDGVVSNGPTENGAGRNEQRQAKVDGETTVSKTDDIPLPGDASGKTSIAPEQAVSPENLVPALANGISGQSTASVAASDAQGAKEEPPTPVPVNPDEPNDEDLIGGGVTCNGACSTPEYFGWAGGVKYYTCLDCEDTDLCADCYATQTQFFTDNGHGFWFKCCWARHDFLELPIRDWRGVKNGMIRIGQKDKPWVDWLESVKKKWARKMADVNQAIDE